MKIKEDLKKIEYHYSVAKGLLQINLEHKAKYELFTTMSVELYDMSLDLLNNRNTKVKEQKLKDLIEEVHNRLKSPIKEEENKSDLNDNYQENY